MHTYIYTLCIHTYIYIYIHIHTYTHYLYTYRLHPGGRTDGLWGSRRRPLRSFTRGGAAYSVTKTTPKCYIYIYISFFYLFVYM